MNEFSPATLATIAAVTAQVEAYPDEVVTVIPEDGDYDHRMVQQKLLSAQVCTRRSAAEAAEWLSTVRPPGTSFNRWEFNPKHGEVTCEQFPGTHRHVIVNC